jgi:formate dehydrogenase major subunit
MPCSVGVRRFRAKSCLIIGKAKKASPINSLTPPVGDANAQTPEYKAFLVDIEPITGPVA